MALAMALVAPRVKAAQMDAEAIRLQEQKQAIEAEQQKLAKNKIALAQRRENVLTLKSKLQKQSDLAYQNRLEMEQRLAEQQNEQAIQKHNAEVEAQKNLTHLAITPKPLSEGGGIMGARKAPVGIVSTPAELEKEQKLEQLKLEKSTLPATEMEELKTNIKNNGKKSWVSRNKILTLVIAGGLGFATFEAVIEFGVLASLVRDIESLDIDGIENEFSPLTSTLIKWVFLQPYPGSVNGLKNRTIMEIAQSWVDASADDQGLQNQYKIVLQQLKCKQSLAQGNSTDTSACSISTIQGLMNAAQADAAASKAAVLTNTDAQGRAVSRIKDLVTAIIAHDFTAVTAALQEIDASATELNQTSDAVINNNPYTGQGFTNQTAFQIATTLSNQATLDTYLQAQKPGSVSDAYLVAQYGVIESLLTCYQNVDETDPTVAIQKKAACSSGLQAAMTTADNNAAAAKLVNDILPHITGVMQGLSSDGVASDLLYLKDNNVSTAIILNTRYLPATTDSTTQAIYAGQPKNIVEIAQALVNNASTTTKAQYRVILNQINCALQQPTDAGFDCSDAGIAKAMAAAQAGAGATIGAGSTTGTAGTAGAAGTITTGAAGTPTGTTTGATLSCPADQMQGADAQGNSICQCLITGQVQDPQIDPSTGTSCVCPKGQEVNWNTFACAKTKPKPASKPKKSSAKKSKPAQRSKAKKKKI